MTSAFFLSILISIRNFQHLVEKRYQPINFQQIGLFIIQDWLLTCDEQDICNTLPIAKIKVSKVADLGLNGFILKKIN